MDEKIKSRKSALYTTIEIFLILIMTIVGNMWDWVNMTFNPSTIFTGAFWQDTFVKATLYSCALMTAIVSKLSKQELKAKVAEKIEDKDLQIEILEDIEDSMNEIDESEKVDKAEYDKAISELEDIKEKYRQRFLEVEEVIEEVKETNADDSIDEVKEEEVIDVQEI